MTVSLRQVIRDLVTNVAPHDEQEAGDKTWVLEWVDSGAQLFRLEKPALPPQHLAVYTVLLDTPTRSLLLADHLQSQAWLFPGGHVDENEDPRHTAVRELEEELQIAPPFHPEFGDTPFFLTVTETFGRHSHTDVDMWFIFQADRDEPITPDPREFGEVRWLPLDDRDGWPEGPFDPGLARFLDKLLTRIDTGTNRS